MRKTLHHDNHLQLLLETHIPMKMPISLDRWVCKDVPTQAIGSLLGHKKEPSAKTSHAEVSTRTLCSVRKASHRRTKDGVSVSLMPTLANTRQIQRWAVSQRSSGLGKEGALVLSFWLRKQRLSCVVNVQSAYPRG